MGNWPGKNGTSGDPASWAAEVGEFIKKTWILTNESPEFFVVFYVFSEFKTVYRWFKVGKAGIGISYCNSTQHLPGETDQQIPVNSFPIVIIPK